MHCTREVTKDIIWVGGNDRRLALFENLFPIPDGVSYNSYVILDEKTAVMDTMDASITRQFIENVEHALGGRKLDYLVIDHMATGSLRHDRGASADPSRADAGGKRKDFPPDFAVL